MRGLTNHGFTVFGFDFFNGFNQMENGVVFTPCALHFWRKLANHTLRVKVDIY